MASLRPCTDGPSPASDQPSCHSGTKAAAESTQGGPLLRTPAHQPHTQQPKPCARQPRHDRITSDSRAQQANGQARALSDYQLGKTIGQGTFGKVKGGFHSPTGERVAIKILEKSKIIGVADEERVTREISILKRSRHPNVIQLYEVIETPTRISLIMEFCDGGEMFDYIVANQRVAEPQACIFFNQVVNGVEYLHSMGVCHRDLKPENLLLQSSAMGWVVKIIDFGLSTTHLQGQLLSTACGSPCYAAPEMVAGRRYVGPKADVWSMGVLLFALVCGYLPFEDTNTPTLYKKILSGKYKAPTNVSKAVKDLISRLLDVDPETRYSIQDIRQHEWYKQIHIDPPRLQTDCEEVILESIMQQLEKLGLCRETVAAGLRQGLHDSHTTAYYLLLKRSRQQQRRETRSTRRRSLPASFKYDPLRMACSAAGGDNKDRGDAAGSHTKEGNCQADKENGPTGALLVVPKLALQEIRAQAENEQVSEADPSYRRQTISGSCKLVKGREEPAAASARPKQQTDAARAGAASANAGMSRQVAAAGGGRPASAGPRQVHRGSTNTVPKTAQAPVTKSHTQRPSSTKQSGGSTAPQPAPSPWTYPGIARAWMSQPQTAIPPADEQLLAGGQPAEGTSDMDQTPQVPGGGKGEDEPARATNGCVDESVDEGPATEKDAARVREEGATEEEEKGSCAEGVHEGSAEIVLKE